MAAVEMRLAALVEAQLVRPAVKRETSGRDAVRIAPGDRPDIGALIKIGFERIETGDYLIAMGEPAGLRKLEATANQRS